MKQYSIIYADPPWHYRVYSSKEARGSVKMADHVVREMMGL